VGTEPSTLELALPAMSSSKDADERLARFRGFVVEHQDRAVRVAVRMLGGDLATAEDVAQEAFIRAFRGLPRFRGDSSLSTWFHRILVREVHRHRRWQQVRRVLQTTPLEELDLAAAPGPREDAGLRRRLLEALGLLTARQRDAVVLVHLEQFTVVEAAAMLGTAPGTVKTHVHRGMRVLRNELADLDPAAPHLEAPAVDRVAASAGAGEPR
jgi:RNA polymerase sigma-70 factor (ECF subfamily)